MTEQLYTPDYNWLVHGVVADRLHHATLSRELARQCEDNDGMWDGAVTFDCGIQTVSAVIPNMFERDPRTGLRRCSACCEATGLPEGTGSPKNDHECRRILGLDGARPTRCPVHGIPDCSPLLNGCSRLTAPGGA